MKPLLLCGTSNPPLFKKIAQELNVDAAKVEIKKFTDGEIYVNLKSSVKDKKVFVLQSGSSPVNDNLMELLLLIDAAKRSGAKKVIAVLAFYPYRRQERQVQKGEAVSAEVVAKMIEAAGATKIIACNLHSTTIETFFNIPLVHLRLWSTFIEYYKKKTCSHDNCVVVAPDLGSRRRSKTIAQGLGLPLAIVEKYRPGHDRVLIKNVVGNVRGKNVIVVDDEINTGNTIIAVSMALKELGVKDIYFSAVHGVFGGEAIRELKKSPIKEIAVTDSILLPKEKRIPKIKILPIASQLASMIKKANQ